MDAVAQHQMGIGLDRPGSLSTNHLSISSAPPIR